MFPGQTVSLRCKDYGDKSKKVSWRREKREAKSLRREFGCKQACEQASAEEPRSEVRGCRYEARGRRRDGPA